MIRPDADTRRIKKYFYNKHMCLFLRLNVGLMFTFLGQKRKKKQNKKKPNTPNCVGERFLFIKS